MKTINKLLVIPLVTVLLIISCNDGIPDNSKTSGNMNHSDKSKKTVIDPGNYIDMTVAANNAKKYTKEDFIYEANGTYQIAGGNSYITVNKQDGTIVLSSDQAFYMGSTGHHIFAKYTFSVSAANSDCLYIRMNRKNRAQFIIDGKAFTDDAVPDLPVCLPLYGFGRNRLEISPVMNGFIAMPSGTYWKSK